MHAPNDPRVLIDYRTSDDAGVYRLDGERALVQTVDFFTPIVDDPFVYGQIAAANALSDVYAMGGRPLTALAIAAFPERRRPLGPRDIFKGGLDKLAEAGVALLGGHTVQDAEIKFGYAVTGEVLTVGDLVERRRAARRRAPPDQAARHRDHLDRAQVRARAGGGVDAAVALDDDAEPRWRPRPCRALPPGAVHACTDVTGFGLIGHASEMAAASRCTLEIEAAAVPLLPGVRALVQGNVPGGGRTNAQHFGARRPVSADLDPDLVQLFYDPQTSGGLLVAVDARDTPGAGCQCPARRRRSGGPDWPSAADRRERGSPSGRRPLAEPWQLSHSKWYKLMFCVVALSTVGNRPTVGGSLA